MFAKQALKDRIIPIIVIVLVVALTMTAYGTTIFSLPLMDEYFLLSQMKGQSNSVMGFLTSMIDWPGLQTEDTWGILASGAMALLALAPNFAFLKCIGIFVHIINSILVYFVLNATLASDEENDKSASMVAGAAAVIFSVYPLAPEAVSWLGGFAYEVGCTFLLLAFLLYSKGKGARNWTVLALGWVSFLLAILCDTSLWSSGFIIVALELARSFIGKEPSDKKHVQHHGVYEDAIDKMMEAEARHLQERRNKELGIETEETSVHNEEQAEAAESKEETAIAEGEVEHKPEVKKEESADDLFDTLVPALPFIVLGVLISLRSLPQTGNEQLPSGMIAGFADWGRVFKHLFFPINESLVHGYARHYLYLYILYSIPLVVALIAMVRNRIFRQNVAYLMAWLIVIAVPHLHSAINTSALAGSRFAYSASIPVTGLIALVFFSCNYALYGVELAKGLVGKIVSTLVSLVLMVLYVPGLVAKTGQQNCAFKRGAKWFDTIATNAKNICLKERAPFALIRDVPPEIAITPVISPYNFIVLDPETRLMKAPKLPGGPLKDALRNGQYRETTVHWSKEHDSLVKVDLNFGATPLVQIPADDIAFRCRPGIEFLRTVEFDKANHQLKLQSNGELGPVLNFEAYGLSLLDKDFFYVDAKIDTPKSEPNAHMEVHWLTAWHTEHEIRDRVVRARVIVNDGQFHRYLLPVRNTGWTTNGPITHLLLGFPASSNVILKEVGMISQDDRIARLKYLGIEHKEEAAPANAQTPLFSQLSRDYPDLPELGLIKLNGKKEEAAFEFDTSNIESAQGAIVEIAKADSRFNNPNGDELSPKPVKTIKMDRTKDKFKLTGKDFPADGVYSIRVFAKDKDGDIVGNSSDEFNCLVYTKASGI